MRIFLLPGQIRETLLKLPMTLICLSGIIMLTTACTTTPANRTPAAETAAANASGDTIAANASGDSLATNEKKLVCHYVTGTGSNIPRKVCAYEKTWDKYNEKTRENAEEYSRKARETGALTAPATSAEQAIGRGTVTGPMN